MDELLTALRYKSEGADIDFKSAQYRFTNGTEDDKGELLKDILAIANAWRDGPGYILLGFRDQRPHPAEVVGINESLDDSRVQQFVHGKVKPALTFSYEEHLYEGKTVGVIKIPKQKRPFYISHAYGRLKSNVVYVRRGSSTSEAEPPEIAAMTHADAGREDLRVKLSLLTPSNVNLPDSFDLCFLQFTETLPDYKSPRDANGLYGLPAVSIWHDNDDFWREYAEFLQIDEALIQIKFALRNDSEVPLSNAKIEITIDPLDGQGYEMRAGEEIPKAPQTQWSTFHGKGVPIIKLHPSFVVDSSGTAPVCDVTIGSLLPGEERRTSGTFGIIPKGPGRLLLRFRILAGELRIPIQSEHLIQTTGNIEKLDMAGFMAFMHERNKRLQAKE